MSQNNSEQSPFDKNLRSLLDAVSMFEREAGLVLDRLGLDRDAIGKVADMLGAASTEMIRPVAAALGIADASAVESLARDVRSLLHSEARLRREQAAGAARLDDFLSALQALGATTAGLADLQARTHDRLDALAARASAIEDTNEQRKRLAAEVAALGLRIEELELAVASDLELPVGEMVRGLSVDALADDSAVGEDHGSPSQVRASGAKRSIPRTVRATSGTHKILEGLPTLAPKVRPA